MNEVLTQLNSELKIKGEIKDDVLEIPLTAHQLSESELREIINNVGKKLNIKFDISVEERHGVPPIVVRVAGFSSYWQDLHVEVQDQLLSRTKQRFD